MTSGLMSGMGKSGIGRFPTDWVLITTSSALGGAERCILDIVEQPMSNFKPRLIIGGEGTLAETLRKRGIPFSVIAPDTRMTKLGDAHVRGLLGKLRLWKNLITGARVMSEYCRRIRAELLNPPKYDPPRDHPTDAAPEVSVTVGQMVHTIDLKSHILSPWTTPKTSGLVWHFQDYVSSRPLASKILRFSAYVRSRTGTVWAVGASESVATDLRAVFGRRVRVETIFSAIDLTHFAPGPGDPRILDPGSESGSDSASESAAGTVRVGLVSTYARWKGHETFLRAIAHLPADFPCRFYVVGGAIYLTEGSQYQEGELKALAKSLGVADRVRFTGQLSDPAAVMRTLDVVVHASTRPEPFGRVIAEAQACQRAVITTGIGGAAELADQGRSARIVTAGNPQALAQAIDELVRNPADRNALAAAGRDYALAHLDRNRLPHLWKTLYRTVTRTQSESKQPKSRSQSRSRSRLKFRP